MKNIHVCAIATTLMLTATTIAYAQQQNPFQNMPCIPVQQTLRDGDTDAKTKGAVSALQLFLVMRAGLSSRQATPGVLDAHTSGVLAAYQKKVGIVEDGVGSATLKHIQSKCSVSADGAKTYKQLIKVGDGVDTLSDVIHRITSDQKQKKPLPSAPSITSYRTVIGFTEKFQSTPSGTIKKVPDMYGDVFYKSDTTTQKTCIGFKIEQKNTIVDEYIAVWARTLKYKPCTLGGSAAWVAFEVQTPHLKAAEDKTKSAAMTSVPLKGDFFLVAKGATHQMYAYGTIDTNTLKLSEPRQVAPFRSMLEGYYEISKKYPISVTPQPVAKVFSATKNGFLTSVNRVPGYERVLYVSDAEGKHYCLAAVPESGKSFRSWGCQFAAALPKTHTLILQR